LGDLHGYGLAANDAAHRVGPGIADRQGKKDDWFGDLRDTASRRALSNRYSRGSGDEKNR
jgi:hypothetical protein